MLLQALQPQFIWTSAIRFLPLMPKQIISNMDQTQQLIDVGTAYINVLYNLNEDCPQDVSRILDILDKVHPDSGYHFGIYIEEPWEDDAPTHACDQSWFHCYQGKEEPVMRRPYNSEKWRDYDSDNMLYLRFTFEMFNHLTIEQSAMGAWQAYLLCVSKTLLPFSGSLYYTQRELVLNYEQLQRFHVWAKIARQLWDIKADVSPYVSINGNQAIVSCCYWNMWSGLVRENVPITFENDKVKIGDFSQEVLYKYNCGWKF